MAGKYVNKSTQGTTVASRTAAYAAKNPTSTYAQTAAQKASGNNSQAGKTAPAQTYAGGVSNGDQALELAQQLFQYYAPGEEWDRNRNSYVTLADNILSGRAQMPDMSKPIAELSSSPTAWRRADGTYFTLAGAMKLVDDNTSMTPGEKAKVKAEYQQTALTSGAGTPIAGTSSGASGSQMGSNGSQTTQQAMDIINGSNLDEGIKTLFRQVVNNWDPAKELNADNVIKAFKDIQTSTIDPYFQQLSKLAIDDVTKARDYGVQQRSLETQGEQMTAQKNIDTTKLGLEASGMATTGEGVKQLGAQSAFAQAGTPQAAQSAMPTVGQLPEGDVPAANRMIASSSQLRYQQNMENLQRQAEKYLGTAGAQSMFPEITPVGGVTGTLEQQKTAAYGSALSGLAGQQDQNVQYQQPINFNFGTAS
jgi:hypothetical protein